MKIYYLDDGSDHHFIDFYVISFTNYIITQMTSGLRFDCSLKVPLNIWNMTFYLMLTIKDLDMRRKDWQLNPRFAQKVQQA